MKKAFDNYRFLIGGRRIGGTVWEGPDHLLVVEAGGFFMEFVESYRRIDYKNIQSIGYARTSTWAWLLAMSGICLALSAWWLWIGVGEKRPEMIFFGCLLGVPMLILLLGNLIKGPTVVCKIQTAVQVLRLSPVRRLSHAQKIAWRVTELCRHHQQDIPLVSGLMASSQPTPSAAENDAMGLKGIKTPFLGSRPVTYGLVMLAAAGFLLVGEAFIQNVWYLLIDVVVAAVAGILCVAGLARNSRYAMSDVIKVSLWVAVINSVLVGVMFYGMLMAGHFMSLGENPDQLRQAMSGGSFSFESFAKMAALDFSSYAWLGWVLVGTGLVSAVCGLIGLPGAIAAQRMKGLTAKPPPPPSAPTLPFPPAP